MGGRLKADLTRIAQVSRQIEQLANEFGQATKLTEGYQPALGDAALASALGSFATDWAIHRARLLDDLEQESKLADTAVKAYNGTDDALAAALRKQQAAAG